MSDGTLTAISGRSRSGKTAWAIREARKASRVLVWDVEDQFSHAPGFVRVTGRAALLKLVTTHKGPGKFAYVPGPALSREFNFWAGAVLHWGRYLGPCLAVAEELADVSTPAKAPANWGVLLRRGLKRGIDIFAISQRWQEADKTAVGNATRFVMFGQATAEDEAYLSRKTRVPVEELAALNPLEFIIYTVADKRRKKGRLRF